jgi:arsenate reductase
MKILIICTGNSCRSQMAQGWLQSFDDRLKVYSAGTVPARQVNPLAIEVMKAAGINISHHTPEHVDKFISEEWDYVITVCGDANENCPVFSGKVKNRIHIGFDDPSKVIGTEKYILDEFIRVRDEIREEFYKLYIEQIRHQI